ncbi:MULTISPECIES: ABC transporter ATP-binding protein [unclassified Sedimentibacter]|uniref:ABC transporter ATP-binding protein n=1 Tax=unclassified Sedimentibacter TaxID=2649220 RepID=UPI0027E1328A|nr:ATP-binding cassette domain-containing protein [Sedimentibacter sp. MB35-C1]WMJ77565.1 ATP-binding cassette domain-containing protein [Sedimentibacter sp. MB35-C1]
METNNNEIILEVKNIRKEYAVKKHFLTGRVLEKIAAVKNTSFEVREGMALGIVGESGSGKSTTGEIAGGLQRQTYGSVFYCGKNIDEMSDYEYQEYRRNVQFIFQDPKSSMDPNYTIGDNVSFPILTLKLAKNKKEAYELVSEMLERVGLNEKIKDKYPSEISGGQCQRAAIARALIVNPRVIICDEPVSALDVSIQAQILNLLKQLQTELKISYIFISHDIGVVNYMSDTILVMNRGSIVESGEAREVLINPQNEYTKKLINSAFIN